MSENPYQDDGLIMNEATLRKKRLIKVVHIAEELMAEFFAEPAKVEISEFATRMRDILSLRITQPVWTQSLKDVETEYPKTAWEHLKKQYAPAWVIRRWPVQYDTVKIDIFAGYPRLAFPKEEYFIDVEIRN